MGSSQNALISWVSRILLLGSLVLLKRTSALSCTEPTKYSCPPHPTLKQFPIKRCSAELLSHREVLLGPEEGVDSIACAKKCSQNTSCELAVAQTFSGERLSCLLLFSKNEGLGPTLTGRWSAMCEAIIVDHCKNGGRMDGAVCRCPKEFTGEYCERVNPGVCNGRWTKILSYNETTSEITTHNSTLEQSLYYLTPKVRVRYDTLSVWAMGEIMGFLDYRQIDRYLMHISLSKRSFDSFDSKAGRIVEFVNKQKQRTTITFNGELNGRKANTVLAPSFEVWSATGTPFIAQETVLQGNINTVKETLRCGNKLIDSSSVLLLDDDISVSFMERRLNNGQRTFWINNKYTFSLTKSTFKPVFGSNGTIASTKNIKTGYSIAYLNPCWFPVQQPSEGLWKLREKVNSYLNLGKDVWVLVDRTYVTVLEAIKEGHEIYAILALMTTAPGDEDFNSSTNAIRSVVSAGGKMNSCVHVFESETIVGSNTVAGIKTEWFIDSRDWEELYAVYTNATVATGDLSELRAAVNTAKTLRLRLMWLRQPRVRYMSTISNSVTDTGQVSSETGITWKLDYTNSPDLNLDPRCDMEKILVNSNGRMEVARFNVFTPAEPEVLNDDILITWFAN